MIGDFLKPPTDNLYKFLAISGLILQLIFLLFIPWNLYRLIRASTEAESTAEILKIDSAEERRKTEEYNSERDRWYSEREVVDNKIAALQSQLDNTSRLPRSERTAIVAELKQAKAERDERVRKAKDLYNTANAAYIDALKKRAELSARLRLERLEARVGIAITIFLFLLCIVGLAITIRGFDLWFYRVQLLQDTILKRQAATLESTSQYEAPPEAI
ncbi:MAG TPA: hypothetical protein VGO56_21435 [Pyrinomonadaceae bacterium]|jgi:hypothetical protein|nr:hypothetical protein [Pyrinomonadaceae bacterium]